MVKLFAMMRGLTSRSGRSTTPFQLQKAKVSFKYEFSPFRGPSIDPKVAGLPQFVETAMFVFRFAWGLESRVAL